MMAKLTNEELAEIRTTYGIKPEHVGKQTTYSPPRPSRKGQEPPDWVHTLLT